MSRKRNTPPKILQALDENLEWLIKNSTLYHITPEELVAYHPTDTNQRSARIARNHGQKELIMVMLPEGVSYATAQKITEKVDIIRGANKAFDPHRIVALRNRGYITIKEPKVIAGIEAWAHDPAHGFTEDPIRSFKQDLFADRDIERLPLEESCRIPDDEVEPRQVRLEDYKRRRLPSIRRSSDTTHPVER